MPRGRSKSILQQIAEDVPQYSEDHLNLGDDVITLDKLQENSNFRFNKIRSKSFDQQSFTKRPLENYYLYPFTPEEEKNIWSEYVRQFPYSSFLDDGLQAQIDKFQNDDFLSFVETCDVNIKVMDKMEDHMDQVLTSLSSLVLQYNNISNETKDFADRSRELIEKEEKYSHTSQEIQTFLEIFESLDRITKVLSNPGNKLVKSESFMEILDSLDRSLEFVNSHNHFKDIDTYRVRFRHCMTRALTLIKNHLCNELKELYEVTAKSQRNKNVSSSRDVTLDILPYYEFEQYYERNKDHAYSFQDLLNQIIKRIENHKEYKGLLDDIMRQYFRTREYVLKDYVQSSLTSLVNNNTSDLLTFSQGIISLYKKIVSKEQELLKQYLPDTEHVPSYILTEVQGWYKYLLEPYHDAIRNRIIRSNNISTLCQLTTLFLKYYEFEEEEGMNESLDVENINWGDLFEPILQDAQTRLIFRIQIYVDDTLMKYKASPEDLRIAHRRRSSVSSNTTQQGNVLDTDFPDNNFPDLYPPLGKALTILSNIYDLINSVVFDDLAHYIVHCSIQILKQSAYKLALIHIGTLDAKLYYLKNLIVLQNQLKNFDIRHIRTEASVDFTSGINEILQTLRNGEFLFKYNRHGGLIELAKQSVPKVVNNMIDAKYEIELELNNAAHELLTECANSVTEPILSPSSIKDPLTAYQSLKEKLQTELPKIYQEMNRYVEEERILKFLLDNLCNVVVSMYENFVHQIEGTLRDGTTPDAEKVDIMEVETFSTYLTDLVAHLYDDDEADANAIQKTEGKTATHDDVLD